jgi:hypothetical protein
VSRGQSLQHASRSDRTGAEERSSSREPDHFGLMLERCGQELAALRRAEQLLLDRCTPTDGPTPLLLV